MEMIDTDIYSCPKEVLLHLLKEMAIEITKDRGYFSKKLLDLLMYLGIYYLKS